MPVIKARAPEYPRPVSPISGDEIPTCKDTVLYCNNDGSMEEDEKRRMAKRRRIEAHATSYLRGQPLFILTAGLRGPFENGWQNPWAEKITEDSTARAAPSPLSSAKLRQHMDQAVHTCSPLAKKSGRLVATAKNENIDADFISQDLSRKQYEAVPTLRPMENKRTVEPSIFENSVQSKDKKVENWLRMSEVYGTSGYKDSISAPPSPSEGRENPQKPPGSETRGCLREDAMVNAHSDNTVWQFPFATASKQPTKSFSSPIQDRALPYGNEAKDPQTSPVRPRAPRTLLRKRDGNVSPPSSIETKAENAILKSRQHTITLNTTATNAGPQQSSANSLLGEVAALQQFQPEYRLQSPKDQTQDVNSVADVHSALNKASASLQTAQEQPQSRHEELGPMSLGKQTIESGMTSDLPSAQIPEIPFLPLLPSNISSHDQMLQESPYHERMASGALEEMEKTTAVHVLVSEPAQMNSHAAPEPEPRAVTSLDTEANGHQSQVPQEIESVVTSKSVLEGASRTVRTLKAPFEGVSKGASPVVVKKMSGLKPRKRQAFSSEDKSGSIKSALKVARPNAASEDTTMVSKTPLEGNAGQQVQEGECHVGVPGRASPITSRTSVPKSILKAGTQHPMKASASNIGSSSTKPDTQKQRTLNLVDNDEGFDLEGAIDDLGSFLDTWDAEKQAAGVL